MGYYTNYTIKIEDGVFHGDLSEKLTEQTNYEWGDNEIWDAKFYDWENHMCSFSKKYPDVLFKLVGDGEESDDMWYCMFKNGKSSGKQKAYIIYPEIEFENHLCGHFD